jgi:hypothetical protein
MNDSLEYSETGFQSSPFIYCTSVHIQLVHINPYSSRYLSHIFFHFRLSYVFRRFLLGSAWKAASPLGEAAGAAMAAAVAAAVRRRDENRRDGDDGDPVVRTATKTTVVAEDLLPPRLGDGLWGPQTREDIPWQRSKL